MGFFKNLADKITSKSVTFSYNPCRTHTLKYNGAAFLKAYEISPYVYACVKLRGEKVGQTEFKLMKGENEIEESEWLDLLHKPNPFMTGREFFELFQTYKDLTGSAYIYKLKTSTSPSNTRIDKNGVVQELHLLRPDKTALKISETGDIDYYEYTKPNGQKVKFKPEDVIASHYPSPDRPGISGVSPLAPGAYSVDTELQLSKYQYNALKNGGKVEGIISYDSQNLTQTQIEDIRRMFAEQYAGADNAGKPLITYGGGKYTNIGLTPTELSYIESKKMTRDDILSIYRVPKIMVAQTDDINRATADTAQMVFLRDVIKPLTEDLVSKLNLFLIPDEYTLDFIDPTPEDQDAINSKIKTGTETYSMTINEKRELLGLDPLPDGDVIYMPFNLIAMGDETSTTEQDSKA